MRRTLVASAVFACAINVACSSAPYYHWKLDANAVPCKQYVWERVPKALIPGLCMKDGLAATEKTSCALGCLIVSPFSEIEAEWLFDHDGMPLRDHEVKHTEGWVHQ